MRGKGKKEEIKQQFDEQAHALRTSLENSEKEMADLKEKRRQEKMVVAAKQVKLEKTIEEKNRELDKQRGRIDKLERRVQERTQKLLETNNQLEQEIENRSHTEKTLRDSEAHIKSILEAAPVGIDLILGEQQRLALFGMPFGNLKDDWIGQWIAVNVFDSLSDPYTFS